MYLNLEVDLIQVTLVSIDLEIRRGEGEGGDLDLGPDCKGTSIMISDIGSLGLYPPYMTIGIEGLELYPPGLKHLQM